MIKRLLIGFVVLAVVIGGAAYWWLGANDYFYKVMVSENKMGPFTFVYMSRNGDYTKIGPDMEMFLGKIMNAYKVNPSKGMAFFYDNPKVTKPAEQRSDIGYLLEGQDAKKMDVIMKTTKVKWIGQKDYVVAQFPIKGNLSYAIGAMKCYPELMKYMQTKGYKMTTAFELYDMTAKKTTYGFQIIR